jgi:hypothetical protein
LEKFLSLKKRFWRRRRRRTTTDDALGAFEEIIIV